MTGITSLKQNMMDAIIRRRLRPCDPAHLYFRENAIDEIVSQQSMNRTSKKAKVVRIVVWLNIQFKCKQAFKVMVIITVQ